MHVLHLIDAAGPQACPTTLALLGESLGRLAPIEQHTLLLGGRSLRQAAQSAGLGDVGVRVRGVPWGKAVHGLPMMSRWLRDWPKIDLVHAWSVGAFTLAALRQPLTPRLLTLTAMPTQGQIHWLRMLGATSHAATAILPVSATIRRELLAGGIDEAKVAVLRPALDRARLAPQTRATLREGWGAEERSVVVALLSDPPGAVDAIEGMWATGLVNLSAACEGKFVRLIVSPNQHRRARAQRLANSTGQSGAVIVDPCADTPWRMLPGCDVALAMGPTAGGLSLLWAMAAGVPIVGEARYAVSEIVEDRHSGLLAKPGDLKMLSRRLEQLIEDRPLAWTLRDTARSEAYSFFSRVRYCQSLREVYEQVVEDRPVEVAAMESTGGLRFAGRG